jgi:dTDP-6-deoxy-L-talose 4-dehydrogenase (NAD+)
VKKILITGGTGFVGRQIVRSLSKKNVEITLVVRSGKENAVENIASVKKVITSQDIFVENRHWWANACEGIDTVVHAAWYVEPGQYLESEKNADCLIGSIELVRGAACAKVARFIGVGTCFEYELSASRLSIYTPLKPLTTYAAAKTALFTFCSTYLPSRGTDFAWGRLFYLYGEGEDERRLVPYVRGKISKGEVAGLTSGKQIRDYLDVSQAGDQIAEIALGREVGPVNICSGLATTVRDLAEKIADEYGRRDLLSFGRKDENLAEPPCVYGEPRRNPNQPDL